VFTPLDNLEILRESGDSLLRENNVETLDREYDLVIPDPGDPDPPPVSEPVLVWTVDLLRQGQRVAMVEAFTFQGVERFNDTGEWSLETSPQGVTAWEPSGVTVNGRELFYGPHDVDAVRLVYGSDLRFAGMVEPVSNGVGGFESVSTGDDVQWRWSGPDLWGVLASRIAYPDPADGTPPWAVGYDLVTAVGSTALASYIDRNLGASATALRRWVGVEVEDTVVGTSGQWSARLQPLSELARRIATDAGIRCLPRLEFDGSIIFRLEAPVNLSAAVVFSDQGDLASIKMRRIPATATAVIAGGQGELDARTFAVADIGLPGSLRREQFSDQRSLVGTGELQRSANATLALGAATWVVDAEVSESVAGSFRYGRDFKVGDIIGIEIDNVRYAVPITSAQFEVGPSRQQVRPILGTGVPDELAGLLKDVSNLAARFDRDIS
jgi:hypothetical protein